MKNYFRRKWLLTGLLGVVFACQSDYLDINTDPNNPTQVDLALMLPSSQAAFVNAFLANSNNATAAMVDQVHSGTWGRWLQTNSDFSEDWRGLYAQSLKDIETIVEEGEARGLKGYVGIAKIQKAYVYSLLVDLWGDVPFSEALRTPNPKFDRGEDIYAALFPLLDEAVADLRGTNGNVGTVPAIADILYRGDLTRWIKVARTPKSAGTTLLSPRSRPT